MDISMAGIDYLHANVENREPFSLTKAKNISVAQAIRNRFPVDGCLLLSTCNRTELWISGARGQSPLTMLCETLCLPETAAAPFFVERCGQEAAAYLFRLTCGMESQIFGEDQILGQIKEAAALAREQHCSDAVLETLFRTAVTGAKQVKHHVRLTLAHPSVAKTAIDFIRRQIGPLTGIPCLIIGNGEMGKLAALALAGEGAHIHMTLRSKEHHPHSGTVIPPSYEVVDYDQRISRLNEFRVIISATSSPHLTLKYQDVEPVLDNMPRLFFDLAVPRDIDSQIGQLPMVSLFDMDAVTAARDIRPGEALEQAMGILQKQQDRFEQWYQFRNFSSAVQSIGNMAAEDTVLRLKKTGKQMNVKPEWEESVRTAANKTVAKLVYGIKDTLPADVWKTCVNALEESAKNLGNKEERS